MPPETLKKLTALRLLVSKARANRTKCRDAQRLGHLNTAARHMGLAIAEEREALDHLDALDTSGALITIEALVSSATSYARERRADG